MSSQLIHRGRIQAQQKPLGNNIGKIDQRKQVTAPSIRARTGTETTSANIVGNAKVPVFVKLKDLEQQMVLDGAEDQTLVKLSMEDKELADMMFPSGSTRRHLLSNLADQMTRSVMMKSCLLTKLLHRGNLLEI